MRVTVLEPRMSTVDSRELVMVKVEAAPVSLDRADEREGALTFQKSASATTPPTTSWVWRDLRSGSEDRSWARALISCCIAMRVLEAEALCFLEEGTTKESEAEEEDFLFFFEELLELGTGLVVLLSLPIILKNSLTAPLIASRSPLVASTNTCAADPPTGGEEETLIMCRVSVGGEYLWVMVGRGKVRVWEVVVEVKVRDARLVEEEEEEEEEEEDEEEGEEEEGEEEEGGGMLTEMVPSPSFLCVAA